MLPQNIVVGEPFLATYKRLFTCCEFSKETVKNGYYWLYSQS